MTPPPKQSEALLALASKVDAARGMSNEIDVQVEIALFEPNELELAIRANDAGTKVVLTIDGGKERTCWARDWTISANQRRETSAALRSLALQPGGE